MPEYKGYEEKVEAMKSAAREASGQGDDYKKAMRDLSAEKSVGEKYGKAAQEMEAMESQRKDLERLEKVGAFKEGVKEAVSEWLDRNRGDVIDAIKIR